jgi:hypothetical protein
MCAFVVLHVLLKDVLGDGTVGTQRTQVLSVGVVPKLVQVFVRGQSAAGVAVVVALLALVHEIVQRWLLRHKVILWRRLRRFRLQHRQSGLGRSKRRWRGDLQLSWFESVAFGSHDLHADVDFLGLVRVHVSQVIENVHFEGVGL